MSKKPLYKSESWKSALLDLYAEKLRSLDIACVETFVATASGKTHVLIAGEERLPPVVLIHGVSASAPIALEPIQRPMGRSFCTGSSPTTPAG
jgi:hypothetical protein